MGGRGTVGLAIVTAIAAVGCNLIGHVAPDAAELDGPGDGTLDAPLDATLTGVDAPLDAPALEPPLRPSVTIVQADRADNNFPWIVVSAANAGDTLRVYGDGNCRGAAVLELIGPNGGGYQQITAPISDNSPHLFCAMATNSAGSSECACDFLPYLEDSSAPPNGGDVRCALDVDHATTTAVAADTDGTIVVAGYFTGPATFGLGEPEQTTLGAATGLFVARYRADCTLAWAREVIGPSSRYTQPGNNLGMALVVGPSTIAVAGTYRGTAVFGPGEATQEVLSATGDEMFLAQFDRDGWLLWAKQVDTVSMVQATGLARSPIDGALYVTGFLWSAPATFGPGEPNETVVVPGTSGYTMYVARFATSGDFEWVRPTPAVTGGGIAAYGIGGVSDGSVVVTGLFRGTATFGPGEPNELTMTADNVMNNDTAILVVRYLADGTFAWAKRAGGYGLHQGRAVAISPDGSEVTITGGYGRPYYGGVSSVTFGKGEPNETVLSANGYYADVFLARYLVADGSLVWARQVTEGSAWDYGQVAASTSDGGVVVAGQFGGGFTPGTTRFGPGDQNEVELWSHTYDVFVARYSAAGDLVWVRQAGGIDSRDDVYGIAVSPDDTTTLGGQFRATMLVDTANPYAIQLIAPPAAATTDAFIARFAP